VTVLRLDEKIKISFIFNSLSIRHWNFSDLLALPSEIRRIASLAPPSSALLLTPPAKARQEESRKEK
jgi:hypothetical protein